MALKPGQALGNYRILSQIGSGGMGMVYLAEHPLIGKKVALKVIHAELSRNKEVVARFFREAKAVNTIGNEHIVEINDFGQTDAGDHFLIMEYLEGVTLADVLGAERVLNPSRAARISAQISSALGAAHAVGIVHRDLKPDNVMLVKKHGNPDFVKLLDFGLAKMLADTNAQQLTAQGVVLGTPQYMSPEACESKKNIDARADIYSLGVLMFQMMTGQLPFEGPAMGEILVKHVTQPPPAPRGINPEIPPSVEQVVLRCLAKDPDSRFPTMLQLREALLDPDRYLSSSPPVMPSSPTSKPQASTMFDAGGVKPPGASDVVQTVVGKRSTAQEAVGMIEPASSEKKTQMLDGGVAPPPVVAPPSSAQVSGPEARTAFMESVGEMPGLGAPEMPDMPQPQPASNRTMVIGTPHGYSNAPPKKKWPLVVALLAILGVGGAVIAILLWPKNGEVVAANSNASVDEPTAVAGTNGDKTEAKSKAKSSDGQTPKPTTAPPDAAPPAVARITVTSDPVGATIVDADDNKLGVTPTILEFPNDGAKRVLELRHPKAKTRTKTLLVTGDVAVTVQMELLEQGADGGGTQTADASSVTKDDTTTKAAPASDAPEERKPKRKRKRKKKQKKKTDDKPHDGVLAPDFD